MKKINLLIIGLVISISSMAQSSSWTKADKNNLYQDCMTTLTKYKNLSKDQRESISLCYFQEIIKKYTKDDFQGMIDIQVKRIQSAVITTCATNIGVNLKSTAKTSSVAGEVAISKKALVGQWVSDKLGVFTFSSDNTYKKRAGGCSATWTLTGTRMLISKGAWGCQPYTWDIIKLTGKEMIIYNAKGSINFSKGNYTFKKVG